MQSPLAGAAIALLIGLLLGLERERGRRPRREQGEAEADLFAGIRTFALFSVAGYVGALGSAARLS